MQAQEFAKQHNAIFKLTSAKQDKGIKELFDTIASQVENKKSDKKGQGIKKKVTQPNKKCC